VSAQATIDSQGTRRERRIDESSQDRNILTHRALFLSPLGSTAVEPGAQFGAAVEPGRAGQDGTGARRDFMGGYQESAVR
jgi:hypothetical protein